MARLPLRPRAEIPEPRFARGDKARVVEPGLTPWVGVVSDVKWSYSSGWWVSVVKDGVGTYAILENDCQEVRDAG